MRVVDIPSGYQVCPKCNERSIDITKTIDRIIIFKCQTMSVISKLKNIYLNLNIVVV